MRNWYHAICEDYDINLKDVLKLHPEFNITERSLSTYETNTVSENPPRAKKSEVILALIQTHYPEFDMAMLQAYFNGEYAEDKSERTLIKKTFINNIKEALKSVEKEGIELQPLLSKLPISLPKKPSELAKWVYKTMLQPEGCDEVGYLLDAINEQIVKEEHFDKVKVLNDAIAPLIISTLDCAKPAKEKVSALKDVDDLLSAPAIAGLSISRSKGHAVKVELIDRESHKHFKTPENVVIEKDFSAENNHMEQRIGTRLLKNPGIAGLPESVLEENHTLTSADMKKLRYHGLRSEKSLKKPFIYLQNNKDYPEKQLQGIADFFEGYHVFADHSDYEIDVFSDEFAFEWLHRRYSQLQIIRNQYENDMSKIRAKIEALSNFGDNKELEKLSETGKNKDNTDYLDALEKLTTIGANMPGVVNNTMTLWEKTKALRSALSKVLETMGAS